MLNSGSLTQEFLDGLLELLELSKRRIDNLLSPSRAYSGMLISQI